MATIVEEIVRESPGRPDRRAGRSLVGDWRPVTNGAVGIDPTELLPAEAGRLEEIVSYGLKSFAHDLVIRKLSPLSSGSTIDFRYFVIHTKWYFRS